MPGQIIVADAFDTYSLSLPLFQTPSPYVLSAASFQNFLPGGALNPVPANIFSVVADSGAVPWNSSLSNHHINADCTQVGTPSSFPNPGPDIYRTFGNIYQSLIWGQWIRINTLPGPARSVTIWRLTDGQNIATGINPQVYGLPHSILQINHPGNLSLVNGGTGGVLASTPPNYPVGSWHLLEAWVYLGNLNGTPPLRGAFSVKLDGTPIMSSANAQTAFTNFGQSAGYGADTFAFGAEFDNVANIDFGPYYVMSAPDASFTLANSKGVTFQTLFANANGAVDQLSVNGASSNFAAINGAAPNPAVYVFTPTAGFRDQYRFPIFSGFSSLFAVCPVMVAESDGPGTRVLTSVENVAGLKTGQGHGLVNGTYKYFEDVYTGITPAQADSGQWGEQLLA